MEIADRQSYARRLFSRAWRETRIIWSLYRWWIALAGPLFTLGGLVLRRGWASLTNANEVTLNAVGGCALAFVGSWIVSLVSSFKLLDDDRAMEINLAKGDLEKSEERVRSLIAENAEQGKPRRTQL
jgi:hypothetical protein